MSSQFGQDTFVLNALGWLRNGFFLDSGASDGIRSSNTLRLERDFGWNGICIEPNDKFFAALVRNRCSRCVNCCLYDQDGPVRFLEAAETLGGILAEYHPDHLRYAAAVCDVPQDAAGVPITVLKKARSLRSILKEYAAPRIIDYWSLDTEGSELRILQSFPFDEYAFRALTVEHNRYAVRGQIREFLEDRGYRLAGSFEIDDCYLHKSEPIRAPLAATGFRSWAWSRVRHP